MDAAVREMPYGAAAIEEKLDADTDATNEALNLKRESRQSDEPVGELFGCARVGDAEIKKTVPLHLLAADGLHCDGKTERQRRDGIRASGDGWRDEYFQRLRELPDLVLVDRELQGLPQREHSLAVEILVGGGVCERHQGALGRWNDQIVGELLIERLDPGENRVRMLRLEVRNGAAAGVQDQRVARRARCMNFNSGTAERLHRLDACGVISVKN